MLSGPTFTIDGRTFLDFSTCSYLGLNRDQRLKDGAIDAVRRYGTSYSSSPAYTALPLYDTLEEQLRQITGGFVAVAQTTTLAHLAALPPLIGPDDLVLIDAQTHESVHSATAVLRGNGVQVETVPHSDMEFLGQRLAEVAGHYEEVWYLADGIYSMHGDVAPVEDVAALQAVYRNLYTYYDDAHGFGWCGRHGRGYVLSHVPLNERMVVAAGFAKAFGSLGAVIAFGDAGLARRVRLVGGPLTFSGPIPPPDLGSAVASAAIHLSEEHKELQAWLVSDIEDSNLDTGDRLLLTATFLVAILVIARQALAIREDRVLIEQQRTDLVSSISHELRTPLTAMLGFLSILHYNEVSGPGERAELIEVVHHQANYLARIVQDLLLLADGDPSGMSLTITEVNVGGTISHALNATSIDHDCVVVDVPKRLIAHVDAERLEQILVNLITNADRYGGNACLIKAFAHGGALVVEVHDSGPGVPKKHELVIWERFERGPNRYNSLVPGTGIGLAVVRAIVEAHGGKAGYRRSDQLGGGCFWVELPGRIDTEKEPARIDLRSPTVVK